MAEKPILFSAAMVRAVLDGSKTVTRRVVKQPKKASPVDFNDAMAFMRERGVSSAFLRGPCDGHPWGIACPYGSPGDQLWVRETWQAVDFGAPDWETGCCDGDPEWPARIPKTRGKWAPVYAADPDWPNTKEERGFPWRSPRFMPRWACRILLDVVSVRPERLHAIDDRDALREGITIPTGPHLAHCEWRHPELDPDYFAREVIEFACLWDAINAKRGFSWSSNPWVWRIEFKRIHTEGATK